MKPLRCMALVTLAVVATGCVDLKAVRDFAGESAPLVENTELATRFRDTYQREQPYLADQAAQLALANDQRRKAAYGDVLKLHRLLGRYLRTLGGLAGDRTFELSPGLGALADGIEACPDFGLDSSHVQAYEGLAKVVLRWHTGARQEQAVRKLLEESDPHLQILLEGMARLLETYRATHANEQKSVLGLLEVELPFAGTPQDRLLATLAKAHLQAKLQEYRLADARYAKAAAGIRSLQAGHRALREQAHHLSSAQARAVIDRFTKDIQTIRKNLKAVQAL